MTRISTLLPSSLLGTLGTFALAAALALGPALAQQRGPIQLFPRLDETEPGDARPEATPERPGEPAEDDAPPAFEVEGLDAPEIDAIGLTEGSLGPDLWRGSDAGVILPLLSSLPVATRNPPLRSLTRRLLITGAGLGGLEQAGRLLEIRIERLLAMGDLSGAAALLEQLPPLGADSSLARTAADVALWSGNDERACAIAGDVAATSDAAYWDRLLVHCRLREGNIEEARLQLDLLRETGDADDPAFFELAERIASGETTGAPPALSEVSALDVAMLRAANLPVPEGALADPSPVLLAAVARFPGLAPGRDLELAERAFLVGALTSQELTARYLEEASGEAPEDVLVLVRSDWGPRTRALALQRVLDEPVPAARAEILDAVWRAARGPERFVVANAFARPFAELPVGDELRFAAPSASQALLAAERPIPAARWFSLLDAGRTGGAQEQATLAPLFALAGFGGRDQVPQPDVAMLSAWQSGMADGREKAASLYALLDGVGARVPDEAWQALLEAPLDRSVEIPRAALWRLLEQADADRRRGETILLALHMLDAAPAEAFPEAVVRGLRGLRRVGLDQEARDIAVAAALIEEL